MAKKYEFEDVLKNLKSLKAEHDLILSITHDELETVNDIEKDMIKSELPRLKNSLASVDVATEDVKILIQFADFFKRIDEERKFFLFDYKQMVKECEWLRNEVGRSHTALRVSEERAVQLEEDNRNLGFLLELKAYDDDHTIRPLDKTDATTGARTDDGAANTEHDIIDSLFPPDLDNGKDTGMSEPISQHTRPGSSAEGPSGYELPPRLKTLHNLVIQYASQGRYEVAIPLCKQTLEDLEKASGRNHPDVATMLNILALIYRDQNKYADSIMLLKEALTIRENTLGPMHTAVAATLNNLAVLYGKQKKYKEAEPYGRRSLMIREQLFGANHPDVAKQLINVSLLCQNVEKYADAEEFYKRAIEIYTNSFSSNSDDVIKSKNNLATMYVKQRKYKEAELIYKEIINVVHEKLCGDIAPNNKPIWMLAEEKQYGPQQGASFNSIQDDKESWDRITHNNWSSIYATLKNLASLYQRQSKVDAAQIIEDLANKNHISGTTPGVTTNNESPASNVFTPNRPYTIQTSSATGYPRTAPISISQSQTDVWSVPRTNQVKSNLQLKPNNLNRSTGPVRGSRSSLATADQFAPRNSAAGGGHHNAFRQQGMLSPGHQAPTTNFSSDFGEGRLKKASSMSLLPGAKSFQKQPYNQQQQRMSGHQQFAPQSWMARGRTTSIENIKKGFGKRT